MLLLGGASPVVFVDFDKDSHAIKRAIEQHLLPLYLEAGWLPTLQNMHRAGLVVYGDDPNEEWLSPRAVMERIARFGRCEIDCEEAACWTVADDMRAGVESHIAVLHRVRGVWHILAERVGYGPDRGDWLDTHVRGYKGGNRLVCPSRAIGMGLSLTRKGDGK